MNVTIISATPGPACLRGKCPEGMRSCGKPYSRDGDAHETTRKDA